MKQQTEQLEKDDLEIIDGELLEIPAAHEIEFADGEEITKISARKEIEKPIENQKSKIKNQKIYLLLPFLFLTVALFGGLRIGAADSAFLFIKPPLIALIFAAILLVLFFRAGLIKLDGWFSEDFSTLKNVANGACLMTLFFASVQIFNSLLPEQGLPFWVLAFCFLWTLWNNLFAEFDTKKLVRSLGAMFGLAFVVKYLILANLTAPVSESFLQGIFQNPTKEALTYVLRFAAFRACHRLHPIFRACFLSHRAVSLSVNIKQKWLIAMIENQSAINHFIFYHAALFFLRFRLFRLRIGVSCRISLLRICGFCCCCCCHHLLLLLHHFLHFFFRNFRNLEIFRNFNRIFGDDLIQNLFLFVGFELLR